MTKLALPYDEPIDVTDDAEAAAAQRALDSLVARKSALEQRHLEMRRSLSAMVDPLAGDAEMIRAAAVAGTAHSEPLLAQAPDRKGELKGLTREIRATARAIEMQRTSLQTIEGSASARLIKQHRMRERYVKLLGQQIAAIKQIEEATRHARQLAVMLSRGRVQFSGTVPQCHFDFGLFAENNSQLAGWRREVVRNYPELAGEFATT